MINFRNIPIIFDENDNHNDNTNQNNGNDDDEKEDTINDNDRNSDTKSGQSLTEIQYFKNNTNIPSMTMPDNNNNRIINDNNNTNNDNNNIRNDNSYNFPWMFENQTLQTMPRDTQSCHSNIENNNDKSWKK